MEKLQLIKRVVTLQATIDDTVEELEDQPSSEFWRGQLLGLHTAQRLIDSIVAELSESEIEEAVTTVGIA